MKNKCSLIIKYIQQYELTSSNGVALLASFLIKYREIIHNFWMPNSFQLACSRFLLSLIFNYSESNNTVRLYWLMHKCTNE